MYNFRHMPPKKDCHFVNLTKVLVLNRAVTARNQKAISHEPNPLFSASFNTSSISCLPNHFSSNPSLWGRLIQFLVELQFFRLCSCQVRYLYFSAFLAPTPDISLVIDQKMAAEPNSGDMERLSLNSNGKSSEKSHLVVCFGEMLIDFVPTVNGVSLAQAPAFKKAPGGAPANVAVCIARLEGSSAFIGKVGDDEFGHMLADVLKENKVDNSGVRFDSYARTALAFVTLKDDGEREFIFFRHPSADMRLQESELDISLIKKATIFHFGSISLIEEPCRSTQLAAMAIARKSGCLLSFDPNLRLALWPSAEAARDGIMSIWDQADIIKVSEDEVAFLTGGDDPYSDDVVLKKLFHPKLHLLLVSEGSNGCRYYTKQFKGRVPGVKVKPVDTTGAGDAFVGGILYSLATNPTLYQDEERLKEALYFANACGALTVTEKGAIPALPTKDAVEQLITKVST